MQRVFVETTVQVQRLLYGVETRQKIDQTLAQHQTLTSTYVWMEVQRTIGQDYQYLINLLLTKQPATMTQLLRLIGAGENLFSFRSIKRLIHIVTRLLDELKTTAINPIAVAYRLQEERRWLLHHEFFTNIHQVLDTTQCDLVQPTYKVATGGRMACRRATARCALPDLLQQHTASLQQLSLAPERLAALETKTQRALAAIQTDFQLAKGEQNCW